jgi:predicted AAA+ superfamily ATPase
VLLVLVRRGAEVSYVRSTAGTEVDFLARFWDGEERLIQVCADVAAGPTRDRELRGLANAAGAYPRASRHLITLTPETAHPWPANVTVHAAEQWLLDEES